MSMHPTELQVLVKERHRTIALHARQARGPQGVKASGKGQTGWLPAWLSLARLQGLMRFGSKAERGASRPNLKPSKPQEQCC
jgi:hypothetical protein